MTVKIVTDSTSDLSPQSAKELGVTVVPVYVRFGDKVYRDGIDITQDEFYQKLANSPVHPATSQPSPSDFADAYNRLAKETDEILSVHVSSKVSGTCESALRAKEMAPPGCRIEVVDSFSVSMGLGLVVMVAARVARMGESLQLVLEEVKEAILSTRIFGVLDTLKYLFLGGRIGKAKALFGTLLNVKPMLTMRDGEIMPAGLARTRSKGLDRLFEIVKNALNVQELAIVHSTNPGEAASFKERLSSILPAERIHIARLGPALGAHAGPGTLLMALRGKLSNLLSESRAEPEKKGFSLPSIRLPKLNLPRR